MVNYALILLYKYMNPEIRSEETPEVETSTHKPNRLVLGAALATQLLTAAGCGSRPSPESDAHSSDSYVARLEHADQSGDVSRCVQHVVGLTANLHELTGTVDADCSAVGLGTVRLDIYCPQTVNGIMSREDGSKYLTPVRCNLPLQITVTLPDGRKIHTQQ